MKGWFQRFMSGRYGFDQFSGFLCIASLILIVIGAWVSPVLYWLGLAAIIYSYFRILSRNTRKRYAENLKISFLSKPRRSVARQTAGAIQAAQRISLLPLPPVRPAVARAARAR